MDEYEGVNELHKQLLDLLDVNPVEVVARVRGIPLTSDTPIALKLLKAGFLVDGGAASGQTDAIWEGLELYRALYAEDGGPSLAYNLANAYVNTFGDSPKNEEWLDHREEYRLERAEARRLYGKVINVKGGNYDTRGQAYANLANQLSNSYRFGEAHDARLGAIRADPSNGVAAGSAARDLIWLYRNGLGSDLLIPEAQSLAQIAADNYDRVIELAGREAADHFVRIAVELGAGSKRSSHVDSFLSWVEGERLTLAPTVELIDPDLKKIDWLQLESIFESRGVATKGVPETFSMFNSLKADFVFARDLLWRVVDEQPWPETANYADTLDCASYGPRSSALVVAHNKAVDILDKVGVVANHYFELGAKPNKIYFKDMWRTSRKNDRKSELLSTVEESIRKGVIALYGLVEIADDLADDGMLQTHLEVRNTGTHRFVVLHDIESPRRQEHSEEVGHHSMTDFIAATTHALRICRSAIQILALAIKQNEHILDTVWKGQIGRLYLPDHDWVRGRD